MEINIKKVREGAQLPFKATPSSVGYDLFTAEDVLIYPGRRTLVPTGIAAEIPVNIAGIIKGRSGNNLKGIEGYKVPRYLSPEEAQQAVSEISDKDKHIVRCDLDIIDGTIDPDYRGEIGVVVKSYEKQNAVFIPAGSRIAQLLFVKVEDITAFHEVEELSTTERGTGGFGHTGGK